MIKVSNLCFRYAGSREDALKDVNIVVGKGEFVLLTGPTGCGKSTLLKCFNGIIPHESAGVMTGSVTVDGIDVPAAPMREVSMHAALVFQSPDDQIFSTVVEDEVAFGPENLCLPREDVRARVDEALAMVGLSEKRLEATGSLSGGQKQRLCIASVLAMRPSVLLLDEPVSQLDPKGAEDVLTIVRSLKEKYGYTIVMVEHRINEVAHLVDRIVVMENGGIVLDAPPREAFREIGTFVRLGLKVPDTALLSMRACGQAYMSIDEVLPHLRVKAVPSRREPDRAGAGGEPAIRIDIEESGYERGRPVLKNIALAVNKGERVALMGNNGSGKSTLLMHMGAMLQPWKGTVHVLGRSTTKANPYSFAGKIGIVFQNPDLMLFSDTVEAEVAFGPRNLKKTPAQITALVNGSLKSLNIAELRNRPPQALSKGQRLRSAVASVASMSPELILLDEPTTGQDRSHIDDMMDYFVRSGITMVFCTHDIETAIRYATRVIVMNGGKVAADGTPAAVFADEGLLSRSSLMQPDVLRLSLKLGFTAYSIEELMEVLC